jgi:two-component system response regulator PilR (NtrC family)
VTQSVVLVVDDEADLAETCARLLRRKGYAVVTATTFQGGYAALAGASPSLLVSDMRLPDGDGLDLVRVAGSQHPPVPAIVISGYGSPSSQAAALAAGAVAFLPKPFTTDVLARAVEQALTRPGA